MKKHSSSVKKYILQLFFTILIGFVFLLCGLANYYKHTIPECRFRAIHNAYTEGSVWDPGATNYHNDVLLNTLFSNRKVYINPKSWYADYVSAFAKEIKEDDSLAIFIDETDEQQEQYTYLNYMLLIAHNTLFEKEVIEVIANDTADGAAGLFVDEQSLARSNSIVIYHDRVGNLYLRGYDDEEE